MRVGRLSITGEDVDSFIPEPIPLEGILRTPGRVSLFKVVLFCCYIALPDEEIAEADVETNAAYQKVGFLS